MIPTHSLVDTGLQRKIDVVFVILLALDDILDVIGSKFLHLLSVLCLFQDGLPTRHMLVSSPKGDLAVLTSIMLRWHHLISLTQFRTI